MSKAPIIHTETFIASSKGDNFSGAFEEGTVNVTYMGHTFNIIARKLQNGQFALKGLTEGLKNAKRGK